MSHGIKKAGPPAECAAVLTDLFAQIPDQVLLDAAFRLSCYAHPITEFEEAVERPTDVHFNMRIGIDLKSTRIPFSHDGLHTIPLSAYIVATAASARVTEEEAFLEFANYVRGLLLRSPEALISRPERPENHVTVDQPTCATRG